MHTRKKYQICVVTAWYQGVNLSLYSCWGHMFSLRLTEWPPNTWPWRPANTPRPYECYSYVKHIWLVKVKGSNPSWVGYWNGKQLAQALIKAVFWPKFFSKWDSYLKEVQLILINWTTRHLKCKKEDMDIIIPLQALKCNHDCASIIYKSPVCA